MHQILYIKLLSSSFQIVTASLNGSRNIKVQNGQLQTEPSILDLYAKSLNLRMIFLVCQNLILFNLLHHSRKLN